MSEAVPLQPAGPGLYSAEYVVRDAINGPASATVVFFSPEVSLLWFPALLTSMIVV